VNSIHLPTAVIQLKTCEESRDVDDNLLGTFPQQGEESAGDILDTNEVDVKGIFEFFGGAER
jgi:hypothetical protein